MQIRDLFGMTYKALEIEHTAGESMSEILEEFAHYLRSNNTQGIMYSLSTGLHPDDDNLSLTTLIYSTF